MAEEPEEDCPDTFAPGDVIDSKFTVEKKIGRGGYGEIYCARYQGNQVAVKVEHSTKVGNLDTEQQILRSLKDCKYVSKLITTGCHEDKAPYMAMTLLGDNLGNIRRRAAERRFSLRTTMLLGMQMIRAVKEVHDAGYLHRDIKPGNFVLGRADSNLARTVIIIDFGLSRKHLGDDGQPFPQRSSARWVGSRRYMSPNTHLRKDQSRRDDLWSVLYCLIEFYTGTLPWASLKGINNLDRVRDLKLKDGGKGIVSSLPPVFEAIMSHIKTLKYEDRPDYQMLYTTLMRTYTAEQEDIPNEPAFGHDGRNELSATESVRKDLFCELSSSDSRSPSQPSLRSRPSDDIQRSPRYQLTPRSDDGTRPQAPVSFSRRASHSQSLTTQTGSSNSLNSYAPDPNLVIEIKTRTVASGQKKRRKQRCSVM